MSLHFGLLANQNRGGENDSQRCLLCLCITAVKNKKDLAAERVHARLRLGLIVKLNYILADIFADCSYEQ